MALMVVGQDDGYKNGDVRFIHNTSGETTCDMYYDGKWFTTLMEACMAFMDKTEETVTGWAKIKLIKGAIRGAGSGSKYSLYNESLASFTTGELYNHKDTQGFITLFGLPLKARALMEQKVGEGQAVKESKNLKKRPTE